jgi:uncharacterized protein YjbJ (UPF0337 family)
MEKAGKLAGSGTGPLTDDQKARIAGLRKKAEAKIAESRIMLDDKIAKMGTHPGSQATITEAEDNVRREKAKIEEETEHRIEKIRQEPPAPKSR